jgi:hypothetical protein
MLADSPLEDLHSRTNAHENIYKIHFIYLGNK